MSRLRRTVPSGAPLCAAHSLMVCTISAHALNFCGGQHRTAPPPTQLLSLVRTDIASPSPPETWADVVAEDPADLLQWATAAKVRWGREGGVGAAVRRLCGYTHPPNLRTHPFTRPHSPQGDALVTCYLRDVHSVLQLRSLRSGALVRDIPLPGLGSVSSFKCKRKSSEAFFSYTSFTDPGSSFRCVCFVAVGG